MSTNAVAVFRLGGLNACAADINSDGEIDIDDLYALHRDPQDINGDGVADAEDRTCLERYLRRHEAFDVLQGRGR